MKKWLLILSVTLSLLGCREERFSNVEISTGDYNDTFFGYPMLTEAANSPGDGPRYRIGYHFDSVLNGKIKITIFSLLSKDIERIINLQSDTLLIINKDVYPSFIKAEDPRLTNIKLLDDTVFVGINVQGCFTGYVEKLVLYKSNNKLQVEYYSTADHQVGRLNMVKALFSKDTLYISYLKKFLNECKKAYTEPLEKYNYSTIEASRFVPQGNFFYEIPDIDGWAGFKDLKENLGIK